MPPGLKTPTIRFAIIGTACNGRSRQKRLWFSNNSTEGESRYGPARKRRASMLDRRHQSTVSHPAGSRPCTIWTMPRPRTCPRPCSTPSMHSRPGSERTCTAECTSLPEKRCRPTRPPEAPLPTISAPRLRARWCSPTGPHRPSIWSPIPSAACSIRATRSSFPSSSTTAISCRGKCWWSVRASP